MMFRFEVIVRSTIVVGAVGAGGLGLYFKLRMSAMDYTGLPVAQDTDYQTIKDVTYDVNGAEGKITEDALGNKMLYIEWDKDTAAADRTATCSFHVDREEILRPELKEEGEPGSDLDEYLEASSTIPVDGVVKETADEITKGKDTYLDKARVIYDWIIANMNRDESVKGCGQRDVCALQSPMISFHRQI